MAVPKITETRCRDGSVQARQVIKRLHKQPHPTMPSLHRESTDSLIRKKKKSPLRPFPAGKPGDTFKLLGGYH